MPRSSERRVPVKHANPHTEESISLRRLAPRPPFPGQRRRHPYFLMHPAPTPAAGRAVARDPEQAG